MIETIAGIVWYRGVGRLAVGGGGRGGSRATIGDADRGVPPDVTTGEEGVRGEDGTLLQSEGLFDRVAGVALVRVVCLRAGVWRIGHADRGADPDIGACQVGVGGEDGAICKTIHFVYRLARVAGFARVGRFARVAAEDMRLDGDEGPREDSGSGDEERRCDGGKGRHGGRRWVQASCEVRTKRPGRRGGVDLERTRVGSGWKGGRSENVWANVAAQPEN